METAVETRICSKCKTAAATDNHAWCKGCKAKYQQEFRETQAEMIQAKAFSDGVAALRSLLIKAFMEYPVGMFYGVDAAKFISNFRSPSFVQKATDSGANGG